MSNHQVYRALHKVLFMIPVLAAGFAPAVLPPFSTPARAQAYEAAAYPSEELDQLTAPIALYPDQLLGQVLMAATYPEEVVQAERWRSGQLQLSGDVLMAALDELPWDPSVKALTAFPQVLAMMTNNVEWTEKLGDAFLDNQGAVMDSVQRLRHEAWSAGRLATNPEFSIATDDGFISVDPVDPGSVYVPWYNPASVFAPWPYAGYMPYYFTPPYGYINVQAGFFGFGIGIAVPTALWGWDSWDWRHHMVHLDDRRWQALDNDRPPPMAGEWRHDPAHRQGVPYESAGVRARFAPALPAVSREFRGYSGEPPVVPVAMRPGSDGAHGGYFTPGVKSSVRNNPTYTHSAATEGAGGSAWTPPANQEQRQDRPAFTSPDFVPSEAAPAVYAGGGYGRGHDRDQGGGAPDYRQQAAAPMFESFDRGAQVRQEAARGAPRAEAPAPRAEAPAPHAEPSAPSGGGDHDRR